MPSASGSRSGIAEVVAVFGPLGVRAFGGPAVHVALMRREVVERRHWVDANTFRELFAVCSLMPGPSSTQLALLLGLRRAGWRGLAVAAVLFIVPSVALMIGIAALYSATGAPDRIRVPLRFIEAAVVGIVASAVLELLRDSVRRWDTAAVMVVACALGVAHVSPLLVLAGAAGVIAVARAAHTRAALALLLPPPAATAVVAASGTLGSLALTFLKIGAVAVGSGYVLLPFLHADFLGAPWQLSDRQIADGFAASQATPGPIFGVAGYLGYLVDGVPGGVVAAAAIFAPSFVFVPLAGRVAHLVGRHRAIAAGFAGAAAGAVGLIGASLVDLSRAAWDTPQYAAITAAAFAALLRWPRAQPWVVLAAALAGAAAALR